jgi:hypothetical protein
LNLNRAFGTVAAVTKNQPLRFMTKKNIIAGFVVVSLSFVSLSATVMAADKWDISRLDLTKLPPAADTKGVTFEKDIHPMFETSCLRCHGADRPKGRLRLDSLEEVLKGGKDGKVVVPGDSKKSLLVAAAAQVSDAVAMPPKKRGPGGPGGPGAGSGQQSPGGAPTPGRPPGGNPPDNAPGAPGGPGGGGKSGPPAKPLTTQQVALLRAWIDQGAK